MSFLTLTNSGSSSFLLNDVTTQNGYGTFPESSSSATINQSKENNSRLENGQECLKNYIIPSQTTLVVKYYDDNKPNKPSSIPRDYLAYERTFLSWVRFSLILIVTGASYYLHFEILMPLPMHSSLLGLFLLALGFFSLLWALFNYFQFQLMINDKCPNVENGKWQFFVAALVGLSVSLALILAR